MPLGGRYPSSSLTCEHTETQRLGNLARAHPAREWKTQDLGSGLLESKTQCHHTIPPALSPTIPEELVTFFPFVVYLTLGYLFLSFLPFPKRICHEIELCRMLKGITKVKKNILYRFLYGGFSQSLVY